MQKVLLDSRCPIVDSHLYRCSLRGIDTLFWETTVQNLFCFPYECGDHFKSKECVSLLKETTFQEGYNCLPSEKGSALGGKYVLVASILLLLDADSKAKRKAEKRSLLLKWQNIYRCIQSDSLYWGSDIGEHPSQECPHANVNYWGVSESDSYLSTIKYRNWVKRKCAFCSDRNETKASRPYYNNEVP